MINVYVNLNNTFADKSYIPSRDNHSLNYVYGVTVFVIEYI